MPQLDSETLLEVYEQRYKKAHFSEQTSSLDQLNKHSPQIMGKKFVDVLTLVNDQQGHILEIGGGTKQVAAIEIMELFPNLNFKAAELGEIEPSIWSQLKRYSQYQLEQAGISRLKKIFPQAEFQLIFSHNVFEFLPDPLGTIEQLYSMLGYKGYLMVNKIPLYDDWWEKISQYLADSQQVFCMEQD